MPAMAEDATIKRSKQDGQTVGQSRRDDQLLAAQSAREIKWGPEGIQNEQARFAN